MQSPFLKSRWQKSPFLHYIPCAQKFVVPAVPVQSVYSTSRTANGKRHSRAPLALTSYLTTRVLISLLTALYILFSHSQGLFSVAAIRLGIQSLCVLGTALVIYALIFLGCLWRMHQKLRTVAALEAGVAWLQTDAPVTLHLFVPLGLRTVWPYSYLIITKMEENLALGNNSLRIIFRTMNSKC